MKTLDEVIKGFECCENIDCDNCPYKILFNDDSHVPCDQFSKDEDALHYLKEYQVMKKVLELKKQQYEEFTETVQKQGQEHEARCQTEIARYQEAVRNCEEAELKYRQLSGELGKNLAEVRNEDQRYPNILFRPDGMYCCVCGSRLDQDREDADGGI